MKSIRWLQLFLIVALAAGVTLLASKPTSADPSIGTDAGSVSGLPPGDILDPALGAPVIGPAPLPVTAIPAPSLGLPAAAEVDALSYGADPFPPLGAPWHIVFSVAPGSIGHPASPVVSPAHPNVFLEGPVTPPGDGNVQGDIYSSFDLAGGPLGSFAPGVPFAPCGMIQSNIQTADEDGLPPFALAPNVGLGLLPGAPIGPPPGDNVDILDMSDSTFVDTVPAGGDGVPELPVFFSVDAATAAALGPLPPAFGPTTAGDVLAWDPGTLTLYNWLPMAVLGLVPGDDIDALAVSWSGAPIAGGWAAPSVVLYSLTPASPSVGVFPSFCGIGPLTAGDILIKVVAIPLPITAIDAEMLGLSALRTGGFVNDDVDAIDVVLEAGIDTDGDLLDNAVDLDDDADGLGDTFDTASACSPLIADTDGDGLGDYAEVMTLGTSCALADSDLDGCSDPEELGGMPALGGTRNPLFFWDFFDVPTPPGFVRNQAISVADIAAVIARFGSMRPGGPPPDKATALAEALAPVPAPPAYHAGYDRTANGLLTGPPDGAVTIVDINRVVAQYGHNCLAPP